MVTKYDPECKNDIGAKVERKLWELLLKFDLIVISMHEKKLEHHGKTAKLDHLAQKITWMKCIRSRVETGETIARLRKNMNKVCHIHAKRDASEPGAVPSQHHHLDPEN